MANLTAVEKETIILFNEGESMAEVYTYNRKLLRRLQKMAADYPAAYSLIREDPLGATTYRFPKSLLSVVFKKPLTEEQSEALRKRMLHSRIYRGNNAGVTETAGTAD